MLLVIDRDEYAYGCVRGAKFPLHARGADPGKREQAHCIKIGLINNMPDLALRRTEQQFIQLLDKAAGDIPVSLGFYSLPRPRCGKEAQEHLSRRYCDIDALWNSQLDALVVTGTEPQASDLRDEPYWNSLGSICDWANENTISSIFSCLAAHAAVVYLDGINRQALTDKCFGIFNETKVAEHILTKDAPARMRFPHSRWNNISERPLSACGYEILTRSAKAGVNLFVKKRKCLFVHFQGHPEYEPQTLVREYRRDIGRFLRGERDRYPEIPQGYLAPEACDRLHVFKMQAMLDRRVALLDIFPDIAVRQEATAGWSTAAISIYRNWLSCLNSHKADKRSSTQLRRAAKPLSCRHLGRNPNIPRIQVT
jgi:homoserine O-succinyltransferase/O-acetyltransferase